MVTALHDDIREYSQPQLRSFKYHFEKNAFKNPLASAEYHTRAIVLP